MQRRDETSLQQSVPQQIGKPFAVLYVSLSSGHRFDVAGIDQNHFETSFKDVEYRFPVNTSTFNSDMRTPLGNEPIEQPQQVISHSREGADILLARLYQATNSGPGVNVYAAAAIIKSLHD
jgi:hypothetical protein